SRAQYPARGAAEPRREDLAARSRPAQRERERERERRVSVADASYNAPIKDARTPKHVIPKRNHAKNNSLSKTSRSLSQGPRQYCWRRPRRPTQTRPYVRPTPHMCEWNAPEHI